MQFSGSITNCTGHLTILGYLLSRYQRLDLENVQSDLSSHMMHMTAKRFLVDWLSLQPSLKKKKRFSSIAAVIHQDVNNIKISCDLLFEARHCYVTSLFLGCHLVLQPLFLAQNGKMVES